MTESIIRNKYVLDSFQEKAFNYIDLGIHTIVSAPTGSGKTTVADYAIEVAKRNNPNAKIIYTCPIKALCNEKYRDMCMSWGSDPYSYTIGLMTGDIIINPYDTSNHDILNDDILGQKSNSNELEDKKYGEIVIMTTEVLQKLMETHLSNKFNPDVIIFDEAHYIDDDSRGHVWEKCIVGALCSTNALLILLSATIGNIPEITNWLNSIEPDKKFESVIKTERPVPLREYVVDCTKSRVFKRITAENDDGIRKVTSDPDPESYEILELNNFNYDRVKKYWNKLEEYGYTEKFEIETICNIISSNQNLGIPAIIFVLSKKKCEELAQSIENTYISFEEQNEIIKFYDNNLKEFSDCVQYIELRKVILKGIGYHHSGLIPKIREVVEFLIKNKLIKIVFATETFAVGLNFPVKTVVMTSLTKPTEKGFRFLTVSEYKQMAGRAGRRFLDPFGNVILLLFNTKSKAKLHYLEWNDIKNISNGFINNVESKYIIEPNYILKNIISGFNRQMSRKSFKYYKSIEKKQQEIICPEEFIKLFEIDKKAKEFAKSGITLRDKNYSKLYSKLSKQKQKEYQDFLIFVDKINVKTDLELHWELEESIIQFLSSEGFIQKNSLTQTGWDLTLKGLFSVQFNEINPVIFGSNWEYIMSRSNLVLPILSMFIDDGIKIGDDEIIHWEEVEPEIIYWENIMEKYSRFIFKCPKWTYWPKNFLIIKEWLENPTLNLDQIAISYSIDLGLFVKILIKMYQIVGELVEKLDRLNLTDLTEILIKQKELLIRPPLKIDSLYVNL